MTLFPAPALAAATPSCRRTRQPFLVAMRAQKTVAKTGCVHAGWLQEWCAQHNIKLNTAANRANPSYRYEEPRNIMQVRRHGALLMTFSRCLR